MNETEKSALEDIAAKQAAKRAYQDASAKSSIDETDTAPSGIPMRLPCPSCGALHVDMGVFTTKDHHTHACQECGMVWRPAIVPTVGVRFLPGFKNEPLAHLLHLRGCSQPPDHMGKCFPFEGCLIGEDSN